MGFKGVSGFRKKVILMGVCLCVAVIASITYIVYAQTPKAMYEANMRKANEYLENGDYFWAMHYFDEAAKYNAKLVTEYMAVYRGFRSQGSIKNARDAIERAYNNALTADPDRLQEVAREFAKFLAEIYTEEYKPKKDWQGALNWFGDWPQKLNDKALTAAYVEVLNFIQEEKRRPPKPKLPDFLDRIIIIEPSEPAPPDPPETTGDDTSDQAGSAAASSGNDDNGVFVPRRQRQTPAQRPAPPVSIPEAVVVTKPDVPDTIWVPQLPEAPYFPPPAVRPPTGPEEPEDPGGGTVYPPLEPPSPPVADGKYHYVIKNTSDQNLTLRCRRIFGFKMAVYDSEGYVVTYAANSVGSISVRAGGETFISFDTNKVTPDTLKYPTASWDKVEWEESGEPALSEIQLLPGTDTPHILTNNTDKSFTLRFPLGTKLHYVNRGQDGEIRSFSSRGSGTVTIAQGGESAVTILKGGGTVYIPARFNLGQGTGGESDKLEIVTLKANKTYEVINSSNEKRTIPLVYSFRTNTYTKTHYSGGRKTSQKLQGKSADISAEGTTELAIDGRDLEFCYPNNWGIKFLEK